MAKLKVLAAVQYCEEHRIIATSTEIARLAGMTKDNAANRLWHLSEIYPYLRREWIRPPKRYPPIRNKQDRIDRRKRKKPNKLKTRDFYKYTLLKQGKRVLPKLLDRYNNGLELNLRRKKPRRVIDGKIVKDDKDEEKKN